MGLLNERLRDESVQGKKEKAKHEIKTAAIRTKRTIRSRQFQRQDKKRKIQYQPLDDERIEEQEKAWAKYQTVQAVSIERGQIKQKRWKKTKIIFMVMLCLYLIFLIYGVTVTDYQYNQLGKVEATKLSVSDIRNLKEYNNYLQYYQAARLLYERCLTLDYRMAQGQEDPKVIAPEYDDMLEEISSLTVKIDAASFSSKYTQLKTMLLSWVKTDIAVYCQNMSASISQNNETKAQNALAGRENMYQNFSKITANLIALGSDINGAHVQKIKEWSPEGYVEKNVKSNHGK